MSDFPFCKIVQISTRQGHSFYPDILKWLEEHNWNEDFDYSVDLLYGEPMGDPVAWQFVFDDARKAVAFKLVWG